MPLHLLNAKKRRGRGKWEDARPSHQEIGNFFTKYKSPPHRMLFWPALAVRAVAQIVSTPVWRRARGRRRWALVDSSRIRSTARSVARPFVRLLSDPCYIRRDLKSRNRAEAIAVQTRSSPFYPFLSIAAAFHLLEVSLDSEQATPRPASSSHRDP